MGVPTSLFVAVSITEMVPLRALVTYTRLPFGLTATAEGVSPVPIRLITLL